MVGIAVGDAAHDKGWCITVVFVANTQLDSIIRSCSLQLGYLPLSISTVTLYAVYRSGWC